MKPLDPSLFRSEKVIQPHLNAGRNVLPKDWEKFLCLIPNNKPFLYNAKGTQESLHTILTSPCFDFANLYELDEEHSILYRNIFNFCKIIYSAHQHIHEKYRWGRLSHLSEQSTFPYYHDHLALIANTVPEKISISASTDFNARSEVNEGEISNERMNEVISTLQNTRDYLLDTENEEVIDTSGTNLSKKAQQLAEKINAQIKALFTK